MITEKRFKEICREEGATEAAVEEYWQFELLTRAAYPEPDFSNENVVRQTIQYMFNTFPSDCQEGQ